MKKTTILYYYLRQYAFNFFSLILLFLIFFVLLALYHIPTKVSYYGFLLGFLCISSISVIHFFKFNKKYQTLSNIKNHITISLDELPTASSLLEQEYQNLLQQLLQIHHQQLHHQELKRADMLDYYSIWVHQIKTPIAAMKLLLDLNPQENYDKLLELQRIEQYVEMALQFLRIEDMSSDLVLKKHNVYTILTKVIKKQATFFISKKLSLKLEPFPLEIVTDEKWFSFVIEQILSNSLKYTNSGYITIYLDPDHSSRLIMEDTGIGIQQEDLPRIFERGFTGYNGRENNKATGIGLYLCKEILNNLHYSITVTSTVGKGTKVILDLTQNVTIFE